MAENESSSGVKPWKVVQIVFLILKLVQVVNWPWWIVLIPLWLHLGLWFLILIFAALYDRFG